MHTQHVRVISRSESVSEVRRDEGRKREKNGGRDSRPREEGERERERVGGGETETARPLISRLPIASDTFPRSTIGSDYIPLRCSSPRYHTRASLANDRDQSAYFTGTARCILER